MLSMLSGSNKVVGAKQVLRAIEAGGVSRVFIAQDADMFVTRPVFDACRVDEGARRGVRRSGEGRGRRHPPLIQFVYMPRGLRGRI